ncbi:putative calcium-binding protein [Yarrowia sp. C11]|nr:putative calcium-binding protein [Yarrowia sp. E02]KAG5365101.1 putative calcium-binding protein [Yarrowia sp. C11]
MSINLTPEEKKLYGSLFKTADKESVGIVTGEDAKVLFQKSSLSPAILGEIWQLSDTENSGFLNQIGFSTALRLIGHAQTGARVSAQLKDTPGPLPKFQGINLIEDRVASPHAPSPVQHRVASPMQQGTGAQGGLPPLTPQDKARFAQLFAQHANNGLVEGSAARDIFLKARLPHETLGQIWNLVDSQNRGSLDQGEFIAAMHLIQSSMNGSMPQVPAQLPHGYTESVCPQTARISSASSVMSTGSAAGPGVIRQYTGQQIGQGNDWSISPQERQRYDGIFAALDKKKTGLIGADAVVPFLTTSRLPEATLAQVWDLADFHNRGEFGRAEFAIAMHLVQQNIGGRELPQQLPDSLLREVQGQGQSSQQPQQSQQQQQRVQSPPISQPKPAPPKPALNDDLVQLNDLFSSPPPQPKQFVPSSNFGQQINQKSVEPQSPAKSPLQAPVQVPTPQQIPTPTNQGNQGPPVAPRNIHSDDILSSNSELSNKLSTASTDFANLSNQIGSLTSQTTSIKDQRAKAESELAAMQAKKKDIEGKLAQLRTLYETEVAKVKQVEQELTAAKADTDKVQQEFSIVDASLHAVQSQHQQLLSVFEADKVKNAEIKENIRLANEEVNKTKELLATAEKEAKHQKNLLSINDKQRSALLEEHAKMQAQIDAHNAEVEAAKRELERRAQEPAPVAPDMSQMQPMPQVQPRAVPAPEHRASPNNPFFSVAGGAALGAAAAGVAHAVHGAGNAAQGAGHVASGPPPISFGQQAQTHPKIDDFDEAFSQMDASPSQAPSQAPSDTPISSVQSDFNEYQPEAAGFTLPLARPHSSTSSVQNNAPLSVRGENFSRPDSPVSNITRLSDSTAPIPFEGSREHDEVVKTADSGLTGQTIEAHASHPSLASKETVSETQPDVDGMTAQFKNSEPFPEEPFAQPFGSNPAAQPAPFNPPAQFTSEQPHPETNAALEQFTDKAVSDQPEFEKAAEPFPAQPFAQPFGPNPTQLEEDSGNESFEFVSADENEHSISEMPRRDKGKGLVEDDSSDDEEVEEIGVNRYKNYQPKEVHNDDTTSDVVTPQHEITQPSFVPAADATPGAFPDQTAVHDTAPGAFPEPTPVAAPSASSGHAVPTAHGYPSAAEEKATAAAAVANNDKELPPNPPTYDESEGPGSPHHGGSANGFFGNQQAPAASAGDDFDDAFADLEESNVEAHNSMDQSQYSTDFNSAFDDMNQTPAPANPPGNDEWEQIFAGMASGPAPVTAAAAPPPRASSPRSRAVQELTGMGFSEEKAKRALQKHKYNVAEATNFLLDQS